MFRRSRIEVTGVVQEVVCKVFVEVQGWVREGYFSKQITIVIVRSEVEEEIEVREVEMIPEVRE